MIDPRSTDIIGEAVRLVARGSFGRLDMAKGDVVARGVVRVVAVEDGLLWLLIESIGDARIWNVCDGGLFQVCVSHEEFEVVVDDEEPSSDSVDAKLPRQWPDRRSARNDMRMLVIGVLVGARDRWARMTIRDKQGLVKHMRAIANMIEVAIGGKLP